MVALLSKTCVEVSSNTLFLKDTDKWCLGPQGWVWGDPAWSSWWWPVQEAELSVYRQVDATFFDLFRDVKLFVQVLSSFSWPVPAVDWRHAWSLRGCQHHDQDAGDDMRMLILFMEKPNFKTIVQFPGDQRHAQLVSGFSDQDSSQDCRCPHPVTPGDFVVNWLKF